jgi:hypothetical protein
MWAGIGASWGSVVQVPVMYSKVHLNGNEKIIIMASVVAGRGVTTTPAISVSTRDVT